MKTDRPYLLKMPSMGIAALCSTIFVLSVCFAYRSVIRDRELEFTSHRSGLIERSWQGRLAAVRSGDDENSASRHHGLRVQPLASLKLGEGSQDED